MKHPHWTALILALGMTAPALAGVVFEVEITDHEASPPTVGVMKISAQGQSLTADIDAGGSGNAGRVIYQGDKRRMVVVDDADKSFFALDEEKVTAMAGQANQAMKQMQEALKNVPEGQRAAFEQMMKQRMPQAAPQGPKIEVKKTTDRAEKNGYPCVRYEVFKDGVKINEMWVTEWKNIPGATEVAQAFQDMGKFVHEITQAFSAAMGGASMGPNFGQDMFGQLGQLGGFPVASREFAEDGKLRGEAKLRSAKQQAIAPEAFEAPTGYKARTMFGG